VALMITPLHLSFDAFESCEPQALARLLCKFAPICLNCCEKKKEVLWRRTRDRDASLSLENGTKLV